MKFLILSDSHHQKSGVYTAIDRERPDVLIFLGDGISDLADLKFDGKLYAVKGNCDINFQLPTTSKLKYGEKTILFLHGHQQNTHNGYQKLIDFAFNQGADFVLFGHTHKQCNFTEKDILFINPGSIGGVNSPQSYSVLTLEENGKYQLKEEVI